MFKSLHRSFTIMLYNHLHCIYVQTTSLYVCLYIEATSFSCNKQARISEYLNTASFSGVCYGIFEVLNLFISINHATHTTIVLFA